MCKSGIESEKFKISSFLRAREQFHRERTTPFNFSRSRFWKCAGKKNRKNATGVRAPKRWRTSAFWSVIGEWRNTMELWEGATEVTENNTSGDHGTPREPYRSVQVKLFWVPHNSGRHKKRIEIHESSSLLSDLVVAGVASWKKKWCLLCNQEDKMIFRGRKRRKSQIW